MVRSLIKGASAFQQGSQDGEFEKEYRAGGSIGWFEGQQCFEVLEEEDNIMVDVPTRVT